MNTNTKELNLKEMEKMNGGDRIGIVPLPPFPPTNAFPFPDPEHPYFFEPVRV